MSASETGPYKDVQSLVKGLRIIEMLSELGWSKIGTLSTAVNIQRTTTYRLINTLEQLGFVTRRAEDGAVALTPKFANLSDGLKYDDVVTQFAWPALFELSRDVLWPCDFANLYSGRLVISLSTHKISPMSIHRAMIGKERSLLRSALGLAILSAMRPDEMAASLSIIENLGGQNALDIADRAVVDHLLDRVRSQGYASSAGLTEKKISAIALPVLSPQQRVVGAVNIVFFRSTMTTEQAAVRYLDKLRGCVTQVERSLQDFEERAELGSN